MATVILQIGDMEVRTHDPFTVRAIWRLLGSSIPPEELVELEGRPLPIEREKTGCS